MEFCSASSRVLSCFSYAFSALLLLLLLCFVLLFLLSESFFFSLSSDPRDQGQLDFRLPSLSFLSLLFLLSDRFSSGIVGITDRLSVRELLPGIGDGCDAMSDKVCGELFGLDEAGERLLLYTEVGREEDSWEDVRSGITLGCKLDPVCCLLDSDGGVSIICGTVWVGGGVCGGDRPFELVRDCHWRD